MKCQAEFVILIISLLVQLKTENRETIITQNFCMKQYGIMNDKLISRISLLDHAYSSK